MTGKHITPSQGENALVAAAKTIGKAAGRVASVLSAATHRSADPAAPKTRSQRSVKKTASRAKSTMQSKPAKKVVAKKSVSSGKKVARKKSS